MTSREYIIKQYEKLQILKKDFEENDFNPNIYPDEGYIPFCKECDNDFLNFKTTNIMEDMKVEIKHPKSCLWYDFYVQKIKNICPSAKIIRNKK